MESFDEWKGKVSELEQCLEEAETKVDPKKSIAKDYSAMQTLLADLQVSYALLLVFPLTFTLNFDCRIHSI